MGELQKVDADLKVVHAGHPLIEVTVRAV